MVTLSGKILGVQTIFLIPIAILFYFKYIKPKYERD
jgi:hypothetical protein